MTFNLGFTPTNFLPILGQNSAWLACYWQGLAVAPGGVDGSTGPTLCNGQSGTWTSGTNPNTQYAVSTLADTENCTQDLGSSANCQAGGVPSNPALATSSPGNAAPSLQGVFTLNVSSDSDLGNLLAGLLDNSTGGVNGTFQDVTYELPTLGLNYIVADALVNASQPNSGVFGAPISEATSPPPPCTGLCSVWNTVSGVVTTIVTGIVSVIGVVWSAAEAAFTYFHSIVQGLAHLAEVAEQATVSVLKAVASALEAAVQEGRHPWQNERLR